jgi:hypothetical protein
VFSENIFVAETGRKWALTNPGNIADVSKPQYSARQRIFRPRTIDVPVRCRAEEISPFVTIKNTFIALVNLLFSSLPPYHKLPQASQCL